MSAACFCGGGAAVCGGFTADGGATAGGGELAAAAFAALSVLVEKSKESGAFCFGVGGSCGSAGFSTTSSGVTISTAIGSAVTALKG